MLSGFREVNSVLETFKAIDYCIKNHMSFNLWQNINGNREIISCTILDGTKEPPFILEVKVRSKKDIQLKKELFLYQDDMLFLFKGRVFDASQRNLSLIIENKYYLKEKRESRRFKFKNISFYVQFDYMEQATKLKKTFRSKILDISDSGLSFSVPAASGAIFYEGMIISLKSLERISFNQPIIGKIVYSESYKENFVQTDLRFGVEFKEKSTAIKAAMKLFENKSAFN